MGGQTVGKEGLVPGKYKLALLKEDWVSFHSNYYFLAFGNKFLNC